MAGYATKRTAQVVLLGLLSVAVIAAGAATIDSTVTLGGDGGVLNPPDPAGNVTSPGDDGGDGDGTMGRNRTRTDSSLLVQACLPLLTGIIGTAVYFGAFAGLLYGIKRRYSFGAAMLSSYGLAPVVFLAYFLGTSGCASAGGPGTGSGGSGGGGVPGGDQAFAPPEFSPIVLVGVLGVVLVAMAAVLFSASGDQVTTGDEEETTDGEEADVTDFAAAAAAAAERLQGANADVDNEVYRAWLEMTNLLDVSDPEMSTPGEFADAAVELGIDREDVDELTRLFEEVRYGHRDPEGREARAVEVFRRIEAEYGEADGVDVDDRSDSDSSEGT